MPNEPVVNNVTAEEKNQEVFDVLKEIRRRRNANRKGFLMLQCCARLLIDFAYCCQINIGSFTCGYYLG